ncbi:MAG: HAMP domain-containing histidine kinase [Bacilli bacterium]|nr:HAMP domain-containing histidine kinase [Bacilli bacterium]
MIRKLRLRFILVALVSILFVLSATIAAINVSNYLKVERETKQSLDSVIEYGHQNRLMSYSGNWGGQYGGQYGGQDPSRRNPDLNEQYFITVFDESGSIEYYDYSHIAPGDSDVELRQLMSVKIYASGEKEGNVGQLRFKRLDTEDKVERVTGWEYTPEGPIQTTEEIDVKLTFVAFLDTSERTHAFNSFFTSSMLIAAISYTVLALLIILSSKLVFKTSEESYKKQKAFITNASHELKTPLTIISTDLELIEMDHGKTEWTESIHDQVLRLNTMTKQLVTLSRLDEANLDNYPFAVFSLTDLANESIEAFAPTYKNRELTFKHEVGLDIDIKANKYLINELFYIFLDNALKYAKDKGEVTLIVRRNANKKVDIIFSNDVEDDEMDTNLLFERFYRSPKSSSKEGSGIGLSIAKEIVELHKGKVNVSVKDGKIYFYISF